jgi:DNA end-binding protein Ku
MWSGSLSFSLVNIPVRMYSASSDEDKIKFSFLHAKDLSPIGYAKYCKQENVEVESSEVVRGYEYAEGEYVVITDEELEKASLARSRSIEILQFAAIDEVDPLYYEKPYYLDPAKGAEKAYVLLRDALATSRKVAIAKFVLRNRDRLALIRSMGDVLALNQLRFASDVRDISELKIPEAHVDQAELDLALMLIDHGTRAFQAAEFHDTFSAEIRRVVDAKVQGGEVPEAGPAPQPTKVQDLMAVLKASLEQTHPANKVA